MRAFPARRVERDLLRADEGPRCTHDRPGRVQRVTPDAGAKEKFLLVDPIGVTDSPLVDAKPLQPASQRQVSLEKLLNRAASQGITVDDASALASWYLVTPYRTVPSRTRGCSNVRSLIRSRRPQRAADP